MCSMLYQRWNIILFCPPPDIRPEYIKLSMNAIHPHWTNKTPSERFSQTKFNQNGRSFWQTLVLVWQKGLKFVFWFLSSVTPHSHSLSFHHGARRGRSTPWILIKLLPPQSSSGFIPNIERENAFDHFGWTWRWQNWLVKNEESIARAKPHWNQVPGYQ